MKALRRIAVITLAVALSGGCMNRADIDKHFENQEKIIAKLDELKKQAQQAKRQHALNVQPVQTVQRPTQYLLLLTPLSSVSPTLG